MAEHEDFHLPKPSPLPIVTSIGIALILFGFVPESWFEEAAPTRDNSPVDAIVTCAAIVLRMSSS